MEKEYVHRAIEKELLEAAREFPVIVLTGPRQSGKSTMLQKVFPHYRYVSFDDPFDRKMAEEDPILFLENIKEKVIIDEIQYVPEILSYIKIAVDKNRHENGLFILTGSQFFPLMSGVSESLAGRAAIYELLGFSVNEGDPIKEKGMKDCFKKILNGFYPDVFIHHVGRNRYYGSYIQTYLERDIRQLMYVQDLKLFQNFLELLAARIGSILNLNTIAKECGISFGTSKRWLSLLESTGIVYLLRPCIKNVKKRVIKSPKLYFTDTGLVSYILKYSKADHLLSGPLAGNFFENFIVIEILKQKLNYNMLFKMYFYRDSNNNEIDLILDYGSHYKLIEIKKASTVQVEHYKILKNNIHLFPNSKGYLNSFSEIERKIANNIFLEPWWNIFQLIQEKL